MRPVGLGSHSSEEGGDGRCDVGDDADLDRSPPPDVAAVSIDLDGRGPGGQPLGVGKVGAEHQQRVGVVEGDLAGRVADQSALADFEGVVPLQAFLRLEREDHRRRQPISELEERITGLDRTASGQDGDGGGIVEDADRFGQHRFVGHEGGLGRHELRSPVVLDVQVPDVARQGQHRHPWSRVRGVHGLFEQAGHLRRAGDGGPERRHIGEEEIVVDLLEVVASDLRQGNLATDRQHRSMGLGGVVEAVEEMDRTGTDRAHADPEGPGDLGLRRHREGSDLLVAHADPRDSFLPTDRVGDRVERVTDDTPHGRDTEIRQRSDDGFGDVLHGKALQGSTAGARARAANGQISSG
ncbi:MAG: hypothetical protein U5K30_09740 [Acidimicrobiales bacterium]|nr:hypothetical protein [Acidimicrobiales bacterium]